MGARRRPKGGPRPPPSEEDVRARLLRWLAHRPRTEQEVVRRLAAWGVDPAAAGRLLSALRGGGLVDDAAFARAYAGELARKGFRGRAVEARLRARGIDPGLAASEASAVEPDDPTAAAEAFARSRAARARGPAQALARRLAEQLVRRGYSVEEAWEAARRAVEAGELGGLRPGGHEA